MEIIDMKVEVKFFARCREIVGEKIKEVEVEEGMKIQDLIDLLLTTYPELKKEKLIISLNHKYAPLNANVKENDEVAVFPPVSGG